MPPKSQRLVVSDDEQKKSSIGLVPEERQEIYLRDRSHPTPRQIRRMKHKAGTRLARQRRTVAWNWKERLETNG